MRSRAMVLRWLVVVLGLAILALGGCTWFQAEPEVDFAWTPASGATPLLVDFTPDVSDDVVSYAWDFGDGSTSTERAPSHTYYIPGTYAVRLTVEDEGGHYAVVRKADCVEAVKISFKEDEPALYWLDASVGKIYSGSRGGGVVTTLVAGVSDGSGLAVYDGHIYWTDGAKVYRSALDGSGATLLLTVPGLAAKGLSIDVRYHNLYCTSLPHTGGTGGILRMSLDTMAAPVQYAWEWSAGVAVPWFVAADGSANMIYYFCMFWAGGGGGIVVPQSIGDDTYPPRIGMSSTLKNGFYDNDLAIRLSRTGGMAIDHGRWDAARYIYWTSPEAGRVNRIKVDGTEFTWLINDTLDPRGVALDMSTGHLYWSDADGIHRMELNTRVREFIYPEVHADALAIG